MRGVGGQDDRAVHLGQLGQPLGAERGVEEEAAGADVEHLGPVADDDQGTLARLQDAVEPLAERLSRRDRPQSVEHGVLRRASTAHSTQPSGHDSAGSDGATHGDRLGHGGGAEQLDARREHRAPSSARAPGRTRDERLRRGADRSGRPGAARHRAHLAEHDQIAGDGSVELGRGHGQRQRQVGRLVRRPAPHRRRGRRHRCGRARPTRCSSTASRNARRPGSSPWAERRGEPGASPVTSAWSSTSSGRWPSMVGTTTDPGTPGPPVGEEEPAGVGQAHQPGVGHLEQAELVGGTEPVLHRPQQPQRVVPFAGEGQDGVDQVLEHPRTGQLAVLGDVADHHHRHPRRLASRTRRAAHSRIWVTDPAVEDRPGGRGSGSSR
jgi:hypothetical protein